MKRSWVRIILCCLVLFVALVSVNAEVRSVVKDDFLINDDVTGGSTQWAPKMAIDSSGNYVVVWNDARELVTSVHAQRYDSTGNKLGSEFRVNDNTNYKDCSYCCIAMDDSGNFIIAWQDSRTEYKNDIYAQMYDSSGIPLGSNFKVSDNDSDSYQLSPSIAVDGSGNFTIAWYDDRNSNFDIYAQKYNSSGTPLGSNFKVNDDAGTADQYWPVIDYLNTGGFIITWEDLRNGAGDYDIYYQVYDSSGAAQGSNIKVNDDGGTTAQRHPVIAIDPDNDFVIAWDDKRNTDLDIYYQRFSSTGTPQGGNILVNDDAGTDSQYYPAVCIDPEGNFAITWVDGRNGNDDIYFQIYSSTGIVQGSNIKVNTDAGSESQIRPSILADDSGDFIISWEDYREGDGDIYIQKYNSSGISQGVNTEVFSDPGTGSQRYPSISMRSNGNFIVVWDDWRNYNWDIYSQRFDSSGNPVGSNVKVNSNPDTTDQFIPSAAMNDNGNYVVVWYDKRNGNRDIYGQRYNSSGITQGSNFLINDDGGAFEQYNPCTAIDDLGNFLVTWYDNRNGNNDIWAQRYDSSGNPQGSNFMVNDDGTSTQHQVVAAMSKTGEFVIAWSDGRAYPFDIYYQRYNSSGIAQGSNIKVNDDNAFSDYSPSIDIDDSGNFVICWYDEEENIFFQRYDSNGNTQAGNIKVNDSDIGEREDVAITISPDSSRIIVFWTDYRQAETGPDIYAQLFINGNPSGSNFKVGNQVSEYNYKIAHRLSLGSCSNRVCFVWQDFRRLKEKDIYGKLTDWDPTRVNISGTVTKNGCSLQGVTVSISRNGTEIDSTATDNSGNFNFVVDSGYDYTVTPFDSYYNFSPAERILADVRIDTTGVDFNGTESNETLDNVIVYPNPWKPGAGDEQVIFANLTLAAKISIFTVAGDLVIELEPDSADYPWNLKNNADIKIASGIYLYHITNARGQEKAGKIAVIR